jgi:adenylylsulfate kinase
MSPGAVVWFTGPPSSGKSTLARRVRARLARDGVPCVLLDGDEVRGALVPAPGYTPRARDGFYATLARLAALLARQGLVVLVPATAHRRAFRERARALAPRFVEVLVDVSAKECARRDAKGLYARARAGGAPDLPGAKLAYERPHAPEVVARGGRDARAVEEVSRRLGGGSKAAGSARPRRRHALPDHLELARKSPRAVR